MDVNFKKGHGFTLIEVLIFVTVLSLFFITAVSITTFSLRNLKNQEHKILATRFAEEGMEWLKQEKEDDWEFFITHDNTAGATDFCLNSSPLDWATRSDCGTDYSLGTPVGFFKRVASVSNNSNNPVDQVTSSVTVSWIENNSVQNVVIKSVFNLWE